MKEHNKRRTIPRNIWPQERVKSCSFNNSATNSAVATTAGCTSASGTPALAAAFSRLKAQEWLPAKLQAARYGCRYGLKRKLCKGSVFVPKKPKVEEREEQTTKVRRKPDPPDVPTGAVARTATGHCRKQASQPPPAQDAGEPFIVVLPPFGRTCNGPPGVLGRKLPNSSCVQRAFQGPTERPPEEGPPRAQNREGSIDDSPSLSMT